MKWYFVDYNGAYIAQYRTLRGALNYIARKGLRNDLDNVLDLVDSDGEMYNPITGKHIEY